MDQGVSRSERRHASMVKADVSMSEILELLAEIRFADRLFWDLPRGVLLTSGSATAALATLPGYPGRHRAATAESIDTDTAKRALRSPVYYVADVGGRRGATGPDDLPADIAATVVDVWREVYPVLCAGRRWRRRAAIGDVKTCAIVCPARSGSTYLSRLLSRTGEFNEVGEVFRHHVVALARTGAVDLSQWWSRAAANGAVDGRFATKLIHDFLGAAMIGVGVEAWRRFADRARDWTIVTIDGKDIVDRAVSMYFAERTGVWSVSDDDARRLFVASAERIPYDYDRLNTLVTRISEYEKLAEAFVAAAGGPALRLNYDDVVGHGPECALRIVETAGGHAARARRRLLNDRRLPRSMSTVVNRRFADRFREDRAAMAAGR